ncbi:MAG TPA: ATP-binding protein [Phycisphaerae bacterium]|nr:ATP-binding protein [Phycisphaerae bacterium]
MAGEIFEEIRQYVGFTAEDAAALAQLREPLRPYLPGIVKQFYEVIDRLPKALQVLTGSGAELGRLREATLNWLIELFSGTYDARYYEERCDIGRAHLRVGMPQHYMFAAMNVLRLALVERIQALQLDDGPGKIAALHRLLDIELAIMNDAYREDFVRRIQEREHAQYQQRLSESEHLASVGQLAASLAHEIKNPLAGISGAIQILGSGLSENHPHKEIIGEALRQIDRLDAAVKDLLVYARPKPPNTKKQSLDAIIERALILLREEPAFRSVRVHCKGLDGEHQVVVDEAQIQQVVSNLLLNAAHACENDGEITCRVRQLPAKIRIIVEDNGKGMPPEVLARVFEPFFTTKARGTGLGLPICKRIVEAHGGTIDIQSVVGKGTRVTVEIPS